jgi:hypothetical protein
VIDKGGLAHSGFSRDQDHLALALQRAAQSLTKLI